MQKNLLFSVIVMGVSLMITVVFAIGADVAEARTRQTTKKVAHKASKKRVIAKAPIKKKMTPQQRRKHEELVAKLKEQDQVAKEAGAPGPMEASILEKSATNEKSKEQKRRSAASTVQKTQSNDLAEVDLDLDDPVTSNQYLPSATEEQLDSGGEF